VCVDDTQNGILIKHELFFTLKCVKRASRSFYNICWPSDIPKHQKESLCVKKRVKKRCDFALFLDKRGSSGGDPPLHHFQPLCGMAIKPTEGDFDLWNLTFSHFWGSQISMFCVHNCAKGAESYKPSVCRPQFGPFCPFPTSFGDLGPFSPPFEVI
jgi:hypothetical protein